MKKAELLEVAATIREEMVDGRSDDYIMRVFSLDEATFSAAKALLLDTEAERLRTMPREHVYVQYCLEQDQTLKLVDELVRGLDEKKQYNAVVGALRLRADLVDRKLKMGFDFGVIKREPERREIIAGVFVADLSDDDLRSKITSQLSGVNDMIGKYGDGDMLALSSGDLHYGPTAKPIETEGKELLPRPIGKAKAKTSRRSGGRKRER